MAPIKVRCTRPMMLGGPRIEAGEVLHVVEPLKAHGCVASGRAEFVDPADAAAVNESVRRETARVLGRLNAVAANPWLVAKFGRAA